jgi:signal transduction histidine kinase
MFCPIYQGVGQVRNPGKIVDTSETSDASRTENPMGEILANTQADLSAEQNIVEDPAVYQALKPYIGHCLTLNHDINNPLAGILGYAEFMLSEPESLTEDQRQQLGKILHCAERIKKLVEALCDEKVALSEGIDLRVVTDAYKAIAKPLK